MAERVYRKKSVEGVQSPTAFGGAPFTQGGHAADAAIGASWAPPSTVSVQGTAQSGQRVYRKKATATAPQTAQRTFRIRPEVKEYQQAQQLQTWGESVTTLSNDVVTYFDAINNGEKPAADAYEKMLGRIDTAISGIDTQRQAYGDDAEVTAYVDDVAQYLQTIRAEVEKYKDGIQGVLYQEMADRVVAADDRNAAKIADKVSLPDVSVAQMEFDNLKRNKLQDATWLGKHNAPAYRDATLKALGHDVYTGLADFNQTLYHAADWIVPDEAIADLFGVENKVGQFFDSMDREYAAIHAENERLDQYANKTAAFIGDNVITPTVAALPNLVLAMMSGGATAPAQFPAGGSALNATVGELTKNPSFWLSFAQSGGGAYADAKASGATELEAQAVAWLTAFPSAVVEIGGGVEQIPNTKEGVLAFVKNALEEGGEEVLQGIIEQTARAAVFEQDKQWFSLTDTDAVFSGSRALQEFIGGVTVGAVLNGGTKATQYAYQSYQYTKLGEQFISGDGGYTIDDAIRIGLSNAKGTDAYNAAVKLQQKVKAGKTVSSYAVGRMVAESQTEQAQRSRAIEREVLESGKTVGYDAEAVDTVARAAVALNQRVRFAAAGELANPNNAAEYHRDTDTVLLNPVLTDVNRLIGGMLAHEMTHTAEGTKQLQTLAKIAQRMEGADGWRALQEKVRKEYADAGVQLSDPEVQKEALAAWIGEKLFTNKAFAKAVADGDANVGNAFFYMIDRVRRAMGAKKASAGNLAMLERLFMQALENRTHEGGNGVQGAFMGYDPETGRPIYASNFPLGTPKAAKSERILKLIQDVWSKEPIPLIIKEEGKSPRKIEAQFDPTYSEVEGEFTDASKLMGGNRHGTASEQRVTLDLADDYYQIASDAVYNYSKAEEGKTTETHRGVTQWHYFINDILFQEYGQKETTPYRVTINVKERSDGHFVYSFNAERQNKGSSTRRTLHADDTTAESGSNAQPNTNVAQNATDVNTQSMQEGAEISAQGALLPPEYRPGARVEGDNPSVTADAATPPFTQGRHAADAANGADLSIDEAAVLDTALRSGLQGKQVVEVDTSAIKHTKHAKRYLDMLERELGTPELVRRMWNATQIERPTGTVEIDGRQVDANAYVDAYEAQLPNDAEALEQHLHRLEAENGAVKEQMYLDGMLENHVFGGLKIDLQLFATKRKLELLQLAAGEDGKKMRQFYEKRLLGNDENHCQELINLLAGRPETYNPIANQKTLAKAKEKLDDEKYKSKLRKRLYAYNKHDLFDSEEVAAASLMINDAINRMELEEAANLVIGLSRKGTEAGRAVQAFSMMGRLTPEGVLKTAARYYAKAVDQIVGDGADVGFDKLAKEILVAIEEAEENGISSDAIAERIRSGDGATSSIASGPPSPQGEVKADVKMTREQLVEALTENLAATEGAYLTRDAMTDLIKRAVNECADLKEQVKRYVLKEIRKDDGALAQRIYEVYQKGDLNRAKMKRAMEEALGLPTLTAEDVQYIVEQTAKIQKLEDKPVEQADAIDDLYDYLGAKLPVSFGEKMAAWRKFAMLFNIRTHARNFFANLAYVGVRNVDSAIATGLELMAVKLNWMKPEERAAAFGWRCTAHGQQILETIKERVPEAVLEMTGRGAKYEETSNPLMRHRKMHYTKWVEALDDFNSSWLEREDVFFFKAAYTNALGQVMTARKATEVTGEMHAIAMKRALEATFRNKNVLSRVLSVPKRGLTSADWKIRQLAQVYDVVLPFVNTPAAIMEQTAMHSPIGLAVGFADLFGKAWGKSDKAAADIINDFAKGIHGSALFVLGIMAVQWGVLRIGYRSGDKDKAADEMEGRMENAIIIGDTAISIDWLQPLAAPLIMGGAVAEALADQDDDTLDSLFGVGLSAANSLLSLSMLQSFYDAVGSYGGDAATSLSTIAENAVSQSVPTLLGQVARILDPVQRKVQDGTLTGSLLNPILAKIPFATRLLDPELDVWGNEVYRTGYADGAGIGINIAQQLAVPWNTKRGTAQDDPISAELLRLYHEHDAGAALPTAVTRKEAKAEGEDWTKLNQLLGGVNRLAVEEFLNNEKAYDVYVETGELTDRGEPKKKKETKYYREMTDEERINVLQNHIYEKAKKEVLGKTAHVPEEYLNESERYFRDLIRRVQSGNRGTFGAAEPTQEPTSAPAQEPAPQQQQASTSYFDDLLRRMRNNGN